MPCNNCGGIAGLVTSLADALRPTKRAPQRPRFYIAQIRGIIPPKTDGLSWHGSMYSPENGINGDILLIANPDKPHLYDGGNLIDNLWFERDGEKSDSLTLIAEIGQKNNRIELVARLRGSAVPLFMRTSHGLAFEAGGSGMVRLIRT